MLTKANDANAGHEPPHPLDVARRPPGAHDVQIEIPYCGVCHSDLRQVRAEPVGMVYPHPSPEAFNPIMKRRSIAMLKGDARHRFVTDGFAPA